MSYNNTLSTYVYKGANAFLSEQFQPCRELDEILPDELQLKLFIILSSNLNPSELASILHPVRLVSKKFNGMTRDIIEKKTKEFLVSNRPYLDFKDIAAMIHFIEILKLDLNKCPGVTTTVDGLQVFNFHLENTEVEYDSKSKELFIKGKITIHILKEVKKFKCLKSIVLYDESNNFTNREDFQIKREYALNRREQTLVDLATSLTDLESFAFNGIITDDIALAFAENKNLRKFHVKDGGFLTDAGGVALASIPKLEALSIENATNISDTTLKALSQREALNFLKLDCSWHISDKGVLSLANHPSLRLIDLFNCNNCDPDKILTDRSGVFLATIPNLEFLNLDWNARITTMTARAFVNHPNIKRIGFVQTEVDGEEARQLLPHVEMLFG